MQFVSGGKINKRSSLIVAFLAMVAIVAVNASDVGKVHQSKVIRSAEVGIAELMQLSPLMDRRIVVLSFDDRTLEKLGRERLTIGEWTSLLSAISKGGARHILIDKFFGTISGTPDELAAFSALRDSGVPVTAASFVGPDNRLQNRSIGVRPSSDLRTYLKMGEANDDISAADWMPTGSRAHYGPRREVQAAFASLGHANLDRFFEQVPVFERFADDAAVPYLPFLAAESLYIDGDQIFVNGKNVWHDDGKININYLSRSAILGNSFSIWSALSAAKSSSPQGLGKYVRGKVVVILPQVFTGGTDFLDTPHGRYPGGYVVTSVLNSVMTGDWLWKAGPDAVWICLMALLSMWLAMTMRVRPFLLSLCALVVVTAVAGVALVLTMKLQSPWFAMVIAEIFCGGAACIISMQQLSVKLNFLKRGLQNSSPKNNSTQ